MITKKQIIQNIKNRHKEELKLADKFLDLKFTYPIRSRIDYKGGLYLIIEINGLNYTFKARPMNSQINNGVDLDLMTVDLSEISAAPFNVAE